LGITEAFKADTFKEKINLGVGAYRMSLTLFDYEVVVRFARIALRIMTFS
jgi:aspartate/tyrosine/aromatic aminotransferase